MNVLLARELVRVLKKNGIESDVNVEGDVCDRRQWRMKGAKRSGSGQNLVSLSEQQILGTATGATEIQLNIEQIATISPSGTLRYPPPKHEDLDLKQVVEKLAPILAEVREYTYLLEKASNVQSNSGNGGYKQLSEFKGAILAAKDLGAYGVQFATWELDGSGTGYTFGHYFGDDYAAAKTDFALRSGLIPNGRYFSEEQLTEMYRCMQDTLDGNYELHPDQEQIITQTCNQIQGALPNLMENVAQSEQKLREWQAPKMEMGGMT